ncbi:hypothetical protein H9Q08_03270 [Chryseobacterium sp. PS-8]|uniref:Uncharacterized protein n=1 Tax=Chryseobacterium indicum TaxID=2766954 RepID=A0ABS9C2A9_9FLAO|nr:hypothetical protein [Chryseobacterium sp. PS-8]MCF2218319.1 hypothetical protein [Chryseobacterium sp. PS-8]
MKISKIPTDYLFIKSIDSSEFSDFAIIRTTEQWRELCKERIKAVKPFENDDFFKWLNYKDEAIDFFRFSNECFTEIEDWFQSIEMFFVETDEEEISQLKPLGFVLNSYQMQVFNDGNAIYNAFEKHLGSEYWTVQFSLNELVQTT